MKAAQIHVAALEFTCPSCGEFIESSTGSHLFDLTEPLPSTVFCEVCEVNLKVPARAFKLRDQRGS